MQPATDAIRYLQSQRPARFAAVGGALPGDLALRYGLYDARGYDFPIERRYKRLWIALVNPGLVFFPGYSGPMLVGDLNPTTLRGLSFFGVGSILAGPSDPPLQSRELSPAYSGPDGTVYANRQALPRAFVVAGERFVEGGDLAFAAVRDPAFDARRTVIREGSGSTVAPGPPPGSARLVEYEADRAVISASASRPATVVLTDLWFPGWKATVDGDPAEIARVDYLYRGVRVGAGNHRIEFSYEPDSWEISRVGSAVATLALVVITAWAMARRRRARGAAPRPACASSPAVMPPCTSRRSMQRASVRLIPTLRQNASSILSDAIWKRRDPRVSVASCSCRLCSRAEI
jgi:hypothetical protein